MMIFAAKIDYHDILTEYDNSLLVFEKNLTDATKLYYSSAKNGDAKGLNKVLDMTNEAALEGARFLAEMQKWLRIEQRSEPADVYPDVEDQVNEVADQLKSILSDFKTLTRDVTYQLRIMKL